MFLICIGQTINQKIKPSYNNIWVFIASILIIVQSVVLTGIVGLNHNDYQNVLQLDVVAVAALYAICYVSRKIEGSKIGKLLERCGNDSFYIMGLHIVGFHVLTSIMVWMGIVQSEMSAKLMSPRICNVLLLFLYVVFGMGMPLLIMKTIRKIKSKRNNKIDKI